MRPEPDHTPPGRSDHTARRARALALLAEGLTPTQVAQRLGVAPRTLRRYLANGSLLAALRGLQTEQLRALAAATMAASHRAHQTLLAIASDDAAPTFARITAASRLIDTALRLYDAVALDERLSALEQRATAPDP